MPNAMRGDIILENLPCEIAMYEGERVREMHNLAGTSAERVAEIIDGLPSPDDWHEWMQAALAGDAGDASRFVLRLPNAFRGWFALGAHHASTPNPVFRAIMADVWDHDHRVLLATVRQRRTTIRSMMRRAAFNVSGLPETFPVYRGTSHLSLAKTAQGLAWTTSYDVAAWFAMRWRGPRPLVLQAQARRSEVVFHHHGRGEDEVMLCRDFRPDEVAVIDDLEEWGRRHAAHHLQKAAWKEELMAA